MHAANCSMLFWIRSVTSDLAHSPVQLYILTHVLNSNTENPGTWLGDIQSRLYWIALVLESLLTDELSLPTSRLIEFQEHVPLPKFLKMESPFDQHLGETTQTETFCHYHFLAQIAHRILINNVKNTLYWSGAPKSFSFSLSRNSVSLTIT